MNILWILMDTLGRSVCHVELPRGFLSRQDATSGLYLQHVEYLFRSRYVSLSRRFQQLGRSLIIALLLRYDTEALENIALDACD